MSSSIFNGIFQALKSLLSYFMVILVPLLIAIFVWVLCLIGYYIKFRYFDGMKPKKSKVEPFRNPNIFKTIFFNFPRQVVLDYMNQDRSDFSEFGLHMIIGEQGDGKSITAAYLMKKWKHDYPDLKIYTNMGYKFEDEPLEHWQELITRNNGKKGVVNVIDDLKAWWSNRDSKDLPAEVLAEICQQRKQKKALLSTIQVFSEAPKAFRTQVKYLYVPKTFLGCLTIVRITKPRYYNEEKQNFRKYCGFFMFAHTKELRDSYDTFKKIEKYKDIEFAKNEQFCETSTAITLVSGDVAK